MTIQSFLNKSGDRAPPKKESAIAAFEIHSNTPRLLRNPIA
ncbi:MAG: hypothetical protein AB8B99_02950 [Phormidesmis sp.]